MLNEELFMKDKHVGEFLCSGEIKVRYIDRFKQRLNFSLTEQGLYIEPKAESGNLIRHCYLKWLKLHSKVELEFEEF